MQDVAALAGVALKTVSRVVNEEPGVSPALEERVRRAIEQLNYRRDANASMLRRLGGKTQTIGLVLEDVSNPFSSALHRAIEDSARARNVLVFAGSCEEDATRERELIGSFRDRRVDGIIVVPASHDHTYLYEEQRAGTALVFVDRPAGHLDADSVVSDNLGGSVAAVEHLLERGHRRIAFLGDLLSISTAHDRLQGYKQALLHAGIAGRLRARSGPGCATPTSLLQPSMSCSRFPIRRRRCSRARTCSRSAAPTRFAAPASTDASRSSASTTFLSPTSSIRRSRSWRRIRKGSGGSRRAAVPPARRRHVADRAPRHAGRADSARLRRVPPP